MSNFDEYSEEDILSEEEIQGAFDELDEINKQFSRKTSIGFLEQVNSCDEELTVEQLILESCPMKDTYSKERYLFEMQSLSA